MQKALDNTTIQLIRQLYQSGISTYKLADEYYVCRQTIWEYVKDIKRKKPATHKLSDKRVQQARAAYKAGQPVAETANIIGCSRQTLYRYIKDLVPARQQDNKAVYAKTGTDYCRQWIKGFWNETKHI